MLSEVLTKNDHLPGTKSHKVVTIYEMKPPKTTDCSFLPQEPDEYPEETRKKIVFYTMAINKVLDDPAGKPLQQEQKNEYKMALLTYCFHLGLGNHSTYSITSDTDDTARVLNIANLECRRLLGSLRTPRLEKAVDDLEGIIIPIDTFRKRIDHKVKSFKKNGQMLSAEEIAEILNISLDEAERAFKRMKKRSEGRGGRHSIGKPKATIPQF